MKPIATLIFLLITTLTVVKAKEQEKHALTGKNLTIETDYGSITWKYIEDDKLQMAIGGTGGSVYQITVDNTHFNEPYAGSQISFKVVALSGSLIKYEAGMPVFEIWGRAGGGSYGRGIKRFVNGKYKSEEGASFTIHKGDSKTNPIYLPGDTDKKTPLYPEKKESKKTSQPAQ